MADLVSPGILIQEKDLTNTVPPVGGSSGGIVIAAEWGPVDEATTITSESDLVATFGKPLSGASADWLVAAQFLAYAGNLQVGRAIGAAAINASDKDGDLSAAIKNTSDFNSATPSDASFIARYPGVKGSEIGVVLIAPGISALGNASLHLNKSSGAIESSASASTTTVDLGNEFDYIPDSTAFATGRGGSNDEVHLVIFDKRGRITGALGTVLEKYTGLSLANDAKDSFGASNYIKDVLYSQSSWVYFTGDWTAFLTNAAEATDWEGKTSAHDFILQDADSTETDDGWESAILDDGSNGSAPTGGNKATLYKTLWEDKETSEVSFLIGGVGVDGETATVDNVAAELLSIVKKRKDCVAFVSPPKVTGGVDITSPNKTVAEKTVEIKDWQTLNCSYIVVDSGWKKAYNRYTDTYEAIPLCGDTAGLTALTEMTNDAWWSPAGYNRGNVRNVYELYYNPDQAARDDLYKVGVNPVVSFPGQGVVLFGDKTSQSKPSAFDRINVRRLFIHIEKAVSTAAKFFMFEFNDEFTRAQFRNMVEPFLRDVKSRRGIFDYQVVCDSTNNTANVIDRNEFIGDIYIKPSRSINFIRLNFVAVRTGVDFSEVAG